MEEFEVSTETPLLGTNEGTSTTKKKKEEKNMEEFSSTSAFLWKAASSTAESHPLVAANLMLRCKRALNETNVGVKLNKLNKTNICQSCGNPWNRGSYRLSTFKRSKCSQMNKLLKKSKCSGVKLGKFQKHLLEEFQIEKSCLKICCQNCQKETRISVDLPPKMIKDKTSFSEVTAIVPNSNPHPNKIKGTNSCESKKKSKKATHAHTLNLKKQKNKKSKEIKTPSLPIAKKKSERSKDLLKNISKNLKKQNPQKPSALTAFLNTMK